MATKKILIDLEVDGSVKADSILVAGATGDILGSTLTNRKTSTSASSEVNTWVDIERTDSADNSGVAYGGVFRVQNNGSNNGGGLVGINPIGRAKGTGGSDYAYGAIITGEQTGSGDMNFIIGSDNNATSNGNDAAVVNYVRGFNASAIQSNSDGTVNFLQGAHIDAGLTAGTVGEVSVALLDWDQSGGAITGDFAYLRIQADEPSNISGTAKTINSLSTLPSTFGGTIESTGFIKTGGTSSQFLKADGSVDSTTYSTGAGSGTVDGTGTDNYVPKWNAAGTGLEDSGARFSSDGASLGIGVDPSFSLDVNGSANIDGNLFVRSNLGYVNMDAASDGVLRVFGQTSGQLDITVGTDTAELSYDDASIYMKDANVGINTDTPSAALHVFQNVNGKPSEIYLENGDTSITSGQTVTSMTFRANDSSTNGSGVMGAVSMIAENDGTVYGMALGTKDGSNSGINEVMRLAGDGNVGIGTNNPGAKLEVSGTITSSAALPELRLSDNTSDFLITTNTGGDGIIKTEGTSKNIRFFNNSGETMRIAGGGNVGIGTDNPSYLLDVGEAGVTNPVDYIRLSPTNGDAAGTSNTLGGGLIWAPSFGGYTKKSAGIVAVGEGNYFRTGLAFYTNNSANSTGNYAERMRIDMDGNVGIGIDEPDSKLHVYANNVDAPTIVTIENGDTGVVAGQDLSKIEFLTNDASSPGAGVATSIRTVCENAGNIFALAFNTQTGPTRTERMRLTGAGRLGIGTDAPESQLEVIGGEDYQQINIGRSDTDNSTKRSGITSTHYDVDEQELSMINSYMDSATSYVAVGGGSYLHNTAEQVRFYTASNTTTVSGTERMRVASDGKVGIGATTVPDTLSLRNGTADTAIRINSYNNAAGTESAIKFASVASSASYEKGGIVFRNTASSNGRGDMHFLNDSAADSGNANTTDDTAMIIKQSGDVGIGDSTPSYKLDVDGSIRATGDVTATSDIRTKENIETISDASLKVSKLRGVEFNKIGEDSKSIGVIAQEIEEVIPEVVKTDNEGMKSVAYGNLVGLLIESNKELIKRIEKLEGIINNT